MQKIINVVAGIIYNNRQVLIASRPINKPSAGYWEFPGGKIETNEDAITAITRELFEEIGIIVKPEDCVYLQYIEQVYPDRLIKLSIIMICKFTNQPKPMESQELYWQKIGKKCTKNPLLPTTKIILDYLEKYNIIR